MKLVESNKSKITKDENCKNLSPLETTEVVLVHCNIVNNKVVWSISRYFS